MLINQEYKPLYEGRKNNKKIKNRKLTGGVDIYFSPSHQRNGSVQSNRTCYFLPWPLGLILFSPTVFCTPIYEIPRVNSQLRDSFMNKNISNTGFYFFGRKKNKPHRS